MNFNFGQLRKNDVKDLYSDSLRLKDTNVTFEVAEGQNIEIKALHIDNSKDGLFQKDTMYALRFNCNLAEKDDSFAEKDDSFAEKDDSFAECEIFLATLGTGRVDKSKKMMIKILPIVTQKTQQVTILFSPKLADFTHICFHLKNKSSNKISDCIDLKDVEFYTLSNLIEEKIRGLVSTEEEVSGDGTKVTIVLKKIGLQGATGLPFMINGEEFKIGKSEIFTSDDIVISSLGIFAVNSDSSNNGKDPYYEDKNFFVLDYEYEEIGGSE